MKDDTLVVGAYAHDHNACPTPALRTCLRAMQLATSHRAGHKLDALTTVSWRK